MSPASYQTAPPRVVYALASCRLGALASFWRAGNGTRTRDPNLGKVVLYQLSYSRALRKSNRPVGWYLPPRQRLTAPTEWRRGGSNPRSEEHTSELQSPPD